MSELETKTRPDISGRAVDWDQVRRRLAAIREAFERGAASPEQKRETLRARGRELAREADAERADDETIDVVEFALGNERYGVETGYVREVLPLREFTPLAGAPPFVLGVMSARGQILSIVDLKRLLDLPARGLGDLNKIVVLRGNGMEFGILADRVVGMRALSLQEIQSVPSTLAGIRDVYLRGVTAEQLIILDAHRLLTDQQLIVRE